MNALSLVGWAAEAAPEMNAPKGIETKLAALRLQRVRLSERMAEITGVLSKLEGLEGVERDALSELAELGLAEIAAVKTWASEGCPGPSPTPADREALSRKLGQAMASAEAMRAVAAQMKDEQREVSVQLVTLNERLEAAALDALSQRFADELAGLVELGKEVQAKQAKVFGCTVFLRQIAEKRQMAGRTDKAIAIFKRLEQSAAVRPEFAPEVAAVERAAPAWRELFEGMIK